MAKIQVANAQEFPDFILMDGVRFDITYKVGTNIATGQLTAEYADSFDNRAWANASGELMPDGE